jgi:hypothetical protein
MLALALSRANADVVTTFQLQDVSLGCSTCPEIATGTFTFDSTTNTILSAAIQTPYDSGLQFPAETYTSGTINFNSSAPGAGGAGTFLPLRFLQ